MGFLRFPVSFGETTTYQCLVECSWIGLGKVRKHQYVHATFDWGSNVSSVCSSRLLSQEEGSQWAYTPESFGLQKQLSELLNCWYLVISKMQVYSTVFHLSGPIFSFTGWIAHKAKVFYMRVFYLHHIKWLETNKCPLTFISTQS